MKLNALHENKGKDLVQVEGKMYKLIRSLVNREQMDEVTTLEGLFPQDQEDIIISISGAHQLKNLKGLPPKVAQVMITGCNGLTSYEGLPKECTEYLTISRCSAEIDFLSDIVGELEINSTPLTSTNVLPKVLTGDMKLWDTGIKSLSGIHKRVKLTGQMNASGIPGASFTIQEKIEVHDVLGLLLMDNLHEVVFNWNDRNNEVEHIIDDFIKQKRDRKLSMHDVLDAQDLLIEKGYEEYAHL